MLIYYWMGPELAEVDDILQETFLAASRLIAQFTYKAPGSFMAWLTRIAEHGIVDAARFRSTLSREQHSMPGEMSFH